MDGKYNGNVHVVIRSVGERTERICMDKLKEYVGGQISLVKHVAPFSEAVKCSYSNGIIAGLAWTLVVDADVIFWMDRLKEFLQKADWLYHKFSVQGQKVFCIQPYVYDNFFDNARYAGVHLYRTEYLKEAIGYCGKEAQSSLRPETYVKQEMARLGCNTYLIHDLVGIHDYFQSYQSIVKKGILHVNKHAAREELIEYWRQYKDEKEDYYYILVGAKVGKQVEFEDIRVDDMYMQQLICDMKIDFPPQPPLAVEEVEQMLEKLRLAPISTCINQAKREISREEQLKRALLRYGIFRALKSMKERFK